MLETLENFESEALLCKAFMNAARVRGWTAYPETADWDIYLVRRTTHVGIQAKLWANTEVLLQSIPRHWSEKKGPHYRAVLVGGFRARNAKQLASKRSDFGRLAVGLRLLVLQPPAPRRRSWVPVGWGSLNACQRPISNKSQVVWRYYRHHPSELPWVPPFVPDVPAGVPSPRVVSPWMVASVKLAQLAETRGWVCLEDARDVRRECNGSWNPSTMLNRYFIATSERVAPGNRQCRWRLRHRHNPLQEFAHVADGLDSTK